MTIYSKYCQDELRFDSQYVSELTGTCELCRDISLRIVDYTFRNSSIISLAFISLRSNAVVQSLYSNFIPFTAR